MSLAMRIFYGFKRAPKDAPDGCEQVWLDDETTGRQERASMLLSARDGDVVAVLTRSDLGRGAEIPAIEKAITEAGAALSVEAPEVIPAPRGRPPKFAPDKAQDKQIEKLYRSHLVMHYVLDRVEQIMGQRFKAHHLKRRYGNRWQKPKEPKA